MTGRLEAVHPVLMVSDVHASIRVYRRLGFALVFTRSEADPKYAGELRDDVEIQARSGLW